MRLLINGRALRQSPVTGVQRYARNMVAWLARLGVAFDVAGPAGRLRFSGHLWEQWALPAMAGGYDVLFCPANLAPLRPSGRARVVVTLHSVAFAAVPDAYRWRFRRYYRWMVPRVLDRAAAVITVSHAERSRIAELYPQAAAKLTVVHHGVDEELFHPGRQEPARPYVLFVGPAGGLKNLSLALAAMERISPRVPHRLVVVGGPSAVLTGGRRWPEVPAALRRRVDFAGPIADTSRLAEVYAGADALLLPSRYESFGLPALEAMACGTVVVCSDLPALAELLGPAGVRVGRDDPQAWAEALESVLADPVRREALAAKSLGRAAEFCWRRCAERTLEVLRRAAES